MTIQMSCLNCSFGYPHIECNSCNGWSLWEPDPNAKDLQAEPDNILIKVQFCDCTAPKEMESFPKICGKCGCKIGDQTA